jgi:hypothetical protein
MAEVMPHVNADWANASSLQYVRTAQAGQYINLKKGLVCSIRTLQLVYLPSVLILLIQGKKLNSEYWNKIYCLNQKAG